MNIASVSTPTPVNPAGASPPKAPDATAGGAATDTYQPTPPPPLPPGQGTRVDQLV